ncbi:up-regulator of cell proliferation-like [Pelobates cultripes]|uniref:Up-regulator of cell proliferation-like n=1 Tax=Pelobates cultripes TaxID=61616 RepID=A0AAD1STQ1_PELCU|nr:up-regulator of cell proliferation-like [Pelobates cultripes]
MEKRNKSMKFCDIIDFDTEKHSWYFPGLWHGVPPMAIINQGYSENVFQLKKYLFTLLKERQSPEPQNINSFMEWTKSLWNAVKHETFIFSFRNILVAEAYDQMSVKYSELEWNFRKKVHSNLAKYENIIKNQLPENLQNVTSDILEKRIKELLDREETNMTQTLEQFFKSGCANVHLIERYRGDFLIYVKSLRKDLEVMASNKCWEAVRIQNVKSEIQIIQTKIQQFIEEKVTKHLQNHRMNHSTPNERELKLEFNALWDNILQEFNMTRLRKHRIEIEMLEQLKREMKNRPGAVTEKLNNVKSLKYYEQKSFEMNNIYMDHGFFWNIVEFITKDCYKKLSHIAHSLAEDCQVYVNEKINTEEDYNEMYCQNLLDMINHKLDEEEVRKLHPTPQFEVDLKLHILGGAAPLFQNMHDNFGINNDPIRVTNNFKPQYFSIFKNRMLYKDKSRRHAEHFCEQCLKPAIKEHTYKNLGKEIIDDMLKCADAMMFSSRKHFQLTLLKELLEINRFENYLRYVTKYDNYVKRWISKYIVKKYNNSAELDNLVSQIVSSIGKKIKAALQEPIVQSSQSVSQMLQVFSMELKKDLVLSKSAMKVTSFQNISNICQFSTDIAYFLDSTEEEIKSSIISMGIEDVLPKLTFKPQDELCQKIIGCGKRCPFCDAPCEAGGNNHQYHFSSFHRPKGLAPYKCSESNILCNSTCSADVFSNDSFINSDTDGKWLQYKDYRTIYPNWVILPDRDLNSSDYWKFVLKQFNDSFAKHYHVEPADIPSEWKRLTQKQALSSLQENMK